MTYNLKLTERIRSKIGEIPFFEKKMFGGVGFLIHGNMTCGVYKEDMIVRVDPEKDIKLPKKPMPSHSISPANQ
jgi:TfoX/Sxy family transcriptional regulator of competence genes